MDNQDQYTEVEQTPETSAAPEFSVQRRVLAAVLVLVAALLGGYLLYSYLMPTPAPLAGQAAIEQPQVEDEYEPPTRAERLVKLETLRVDTTVAVPSPAERMSRLEQLRPVDETGE